MAPTIQNNTAPDKRPPRSIEKKSDLVCKVRYANMLPNIPFDLKFLSYPFSPMRYIQYNPTSLERSYKFEILADHDLGLNIDLVNKDKYSIDSNAQMDPADEKLLKGNILVPQDSKRTISNVDDTIVSSLETEVLNVEKPLPETIKKKKSTQDNIGLLLSELQSTCRSKSPPQPPVLTSDDKFCDYLSSIMAELPKAKKMKLQAKFINDVLVEYEK